MRKLLSVFLVLLLLFIWQLYRGPVAVPFLKPYIIKALNHDDAEYQVTLDSVNLELVRSIKPLRIIANNVVYKKIKNDIINPGSFKDLELILTWDVLCPKLSKTVRAVPLCAIRTEYMTSSKR